MPTLFCPPLPLFVSLYFHFFLSSSLLFPSPFSPLSILLPSHHSLLLVSYPSLFISPPPPVQLLQAVYDDLVPSLKVLDITIEDPSEEFSALRDFVDCRSALRLSCLQMEDLHKGSEEPVKVLRTKLKLQKVRDGVRKLM